MQAASPAASPWQRITETRTWQTLRAATWLEWQTRGNWTNPWLFALYLLLRPVSASLVLVFMYRVVSGGQATQGSILGFLIIGSASWSFVEQIISGIPQAVLADREEYAMLKYVYIAPQQFIVFLVGRSVPRMFMGLISFAVTLTFGTFFLGVPINLFRINYPLLLLALVVGFVAIVAFGVAFAGLSLVLKRGAYQMPQAVTGALYLVSGAIFPIAILPTWLQTVSLIVPLTYWLELIRRALLGNAAITSFGAARFPVTSTWGTIGLFGLTTAVFGIICYVAFRISEFQARERGQIDRTTGS